ncbi:MAG: sterol desaturase family protein [Betaproteobacteria bacterium]|nr:sterol desaturase family protein [Betaproteobacteria bacterium]
MVTNPMAFAQHANVKFPDWLERWGHLLIITPALHRVHHSTDPADHDQNFGELFSWWDRLFATYRTPSGEVTVGLPGFEDRLADAHRNAGDALECAAGSGSRVVSLGASPTRTCEVPC